MVWSSQYHKSNAFEGLSGCRDDLKRFEIAELEGNIHYADPWLFHTGLEPGSFLVSDDEQGASVDEDDEVKYRAIIRFFLIEFAILLSASG